MPVALRAGSLALVGLGVACAVPPLSPATSHRQPSGPRSVEPVAAHRAFDRLIVEGQAIPAMWLTRDADGGAPSNRDIEGSGYGVRAAAGGDETSVGFLFQQFFTSRDEFDAQIFSVDFDAHTPLEAEHRWFWLRAGGSVGCTWADEPGDDEIDGDLAFQLRLGVDFQPSDAFSIGASFGGIVVGHPGETEAYGSMVMIGAALIF
jgi:hypothetical protein